MKKSYEMDMCSGPVLGKILIYSFPLMLSGILQLLFNAADVIVVGRYAGSQSLAAVGSTGRGLHRRSDQSADQCVHRFVRGSQRAGGPVLRGKERSGRQ